jgi:hypothetical protein
MTAREATLETCIEGSNPCRYKPPLRDWVGGTGRGEGVVELAVTKEGFEMIASDSRHGLCLQKTDFRFTFAILDRPVNKCKSIESGT